MGFERVVAAVCLLTAVAASPASAQEAQREPVAKEPEAPAPRPKRLEPGPAPADGVEVLVVDAESGEPVANALVTWFEEKDGFDARVLPEAQLEAERIEHGKTVATDANGLAKIARSSLIVASAGDRCAARRWTRAVESPMKFALKRARRLDVVVVDEQGQPVAGAPLSLSGYEGSQGPARSWQLPTGADGKASFAPLDLFLGFELRTPHELYLRVDAPLGDTNGKFEKKLDDRGLPDAPVKFTLPATGTLALELADDRGAPLSGNHYVTIETLPAGSADAAFEEAKKTGHGSEWFCFDARSSYELRGVALARRVRIEVMDDSFERSEVTIDGPTKSGEVVHARVVVAAAKAFEIVATMVGPDGKAIADASFTIRLVVPADANEKEQKDAIDAKSDAKGAWRARHEAGFGDSDFEAFERRIASVEIEQTGPNGVVATGRCPFPETKPGQAHDLGTVKLEATPLLLSGVVVDDAGKPVAKAKVVLEGEEREEDTGPRAGSFPPALSIEAESAADGSFELHGLALPDADYRATAMGPADAGAPGATEYADWFHGANKVAVDPGTRDVRLVLWRCGTIVGSIEGDEEQIDQLTFDVHWKRTDGEESGFGGGNPEASFSLEGIPVGVATVKLVNGDDDAVATFDGVVVEPGKTTRLPPVVLSPPKHVLALTIRDEAGRPVPRGWVTWPDPKDEARFAESLAFFSAMHHDLVDDILGSSRTPAATEFADGELELQRDRPFRALAVGAPGCTAVVLHDVEGPTIVTLRPAPRVSLVLDLEGEAPADRAVFATFTAPSDDPDWFRHRPGPMFHLSGVQDEMWRMPPVRLEPGRAVPFHANATGKLRANVMVGELRGSGYSGSTITSDPRTITITETRDLQVFHVRVSADALKAATSVGERR